MDDEDSEEESAQDSLSAGRNAQSQPEKRDSLAVESDSLKIENYDVKLK